LEIKMIEISNYYISQHFTMFLGGNGESAYAAERGKAFILIFYCPGYVLS